MPLGRRLIIGGELLGRNAGDARFEGMSGRPPELARHAEAAIAERANVGRKQKGFAEGDDLRLEALLRALRGEQSIVRREEVAGDDLDIAFLERCDLRR